MAQRSKGNQHRTRSFIILVLVVLVGGMMLNSAGYLVSPFEFSKVLLQTDLTPPSEDMGFQMVDLDALETTTGTGTDGSDTAGADATSDLTDLQDDAMHRPSGEDITLSDYFDFAWEDIGSVFYNLWIMLALTVAVIVIARPTGWIVRRIKQA